MPNSTNIVWILLICLTLISTDDNKLYKRHVE